MRALVTGGAGFIGSTLVDRLLAEGHAVDVIDNLSSGKLSNLAEARANRGPRPHLPPDRHPRTRSGVELIERRQPEVVFHLAAQADVRVSVTDPVLDASINVIGALNVLEGRSTSGRRRRWCSPRAAEPSTASPTAPALPVDETHPLRPESPYGMTQARVHRLPRRCTASSTTSSSPRWPSANVYGPRQDPHGEAGVVSIFAGRLLAGEPCTIFGDGEQTRDFVFVDDVVDAFVRAATRGGGLLFNIGTGDEVSVNRAVPLDGGGRRRDGAGRSTRRLGPGELKRSRARAPRRRRSTSAGRRGPTSTPARAQ